MKIPRDITGRILWSRIPGFEEFFKGIRALAWYEIRGKILEQYGLGITENQAKKLKKRHTLQTATLAVESPQVKAEPKEAASEAEQLDREMLRHKVSELTKKNTLYDIIGEAFISAVKEVGSLPQPQLIAPVESYESQGNEDHALLISDVQAGLIVDSKGVGGLGEYSPEITIQMLDFLQSVIDRIRAHHPDSTRMHLLMLGDLVDGMSIYPGHLRHIEFGAAKQVMFCTEQFARFIHFLASRYEEVIVPCIVGNHGRASGRPGEFSPLDNFDYLVYKYLELRLADVKNVKFIIPDTWFVVHEIQGHKFLLVHGDDMGSSFASIPYYGIDRMKAKWRELLKNQDLDFDYMCLGHHHTPAMFHNVLVNGSFCGGTEFSLKKLQLGDLPQQKFIGVHDKYGVTFVRDLNLKPIA